MRTFTYMGKTYVGFDKDVESGPDRIALVKIGRENQLFAIDKDPQARGQLRKYLDTLPEGTFILAYYNLV